MTTTSDVKAVARYAMGILDEPERERILHESTAAPSLESTVEESAYEGSAEMRDSVASAGRKLSAGEGLTSTEAFALEAIILPNKRPVLDVLYDTFHEPPQRRWRLLHEAPRKRHLDCAIAGVGRIRIEGEDGQGGIATGFMVSRTMMLTNRHVADDLARGVGLDLEFIPGVTSGVNLRHEVDPNNEPIHLKVDSTPLIHPYWDAAVVQVSGYPDDREPLLLAGQRPDAVEGRMVAAIGYPGFDDRNDEDVQIRVFRGRFGYKRLQPGFVTDAAQSVVSFGKKVVALAHDCSTLGGNSGSALVDVETGEVLGIHFGGAYLKSNYAVPAWELARDPNIRKLELNFSDTPSAEPPEWLSAWDAIEDTTTVVSPGVPDADDDGATDGQDNDSSKAGGAGIQFAPGWYERVSDEEIIRAYSLHPGEVKRELDAVMGPKEADDLLADLKQLHEVPKVDESIEEGLFWTKPDPELPEIILLHGIMGGHLAHAGFFRNRIWLDVKELLKGSIPEKMSLRADGVSDMPGMRIEPDGQIKLKYNKAARKWRKRRFMVHQFSYDWRKGVQHAAARLNALIENRVLESPSSRFVLVAHSMGGLVSSIYSHRYPVWQDRVEQAIFVGSPLGGSYAVPTAITGQDSFIGNLAYWSRKDDNSEFASMAQGFPGLIDMLPHPQLFPEAAPLYSEAGWPAGRAPAARWLRQSENLKPLLRDSPILGRTTLFVSLGHGTVSEMNLQDGHLQLGPNNGIGDGTVHHKSSLIDGVPAYKATLPHGDLMIDTDVIRGVAQLILTGIPGLDPVQPSDLEGEIVGQESAQWMDEGALDAARQRFEEGVLTDRDLRLFDTW